MGLRAVSILLFVVVVDCIHGNAISLVTSDTAAKEVQTKVSRELSRNGEVCTLCQEFTTKAVDYLAEKKVQADIIIYLHLACSRLHALKHQCVMLVDYYAPLLFAEIATVEPDQLCEKVNLCEEFISLRLQKRDETCTLCHIVVSKILKKLEDTDSQLELIEVLLKGCSKVENILPEAILSTKTLTLQPCKKLVFQYGPIILANAAKYLEATDLCAAMLLCEGSNNADSLKEMLISSA